MARRPRRDDPDRNRAEEDSGDFVPPSRGTANVTIVFLVAAGLLLIAFFILEMRIEDLGGAVVIAIVVAAVLLISRSLFGAR